MLPTHEDYQSGCHTWKGRYKDINYKITHHGISEYNPTGIWCFYVFFKEEMFQNSEDWEQFNFKTSLKNFGNILYEHFPYESIPELPWHSGPTYGKRHEYVNRNGNRVASIEIGCDYGHFWDCEQGYPYTFQSVKNDVENLIETFLHQFPQKTVCAYSGKIDYDSEFYEANNGLMIHKSMLDEIKRSNWKHWFPKQEI